MRHTINLERIAELKEMDDPGSEEIQRQLVEMFLDSSPEKISDLKTIVDPVELKKMAHSLKSTSLNMGCEILADLCQKIEQGDGDIKMLVQSCEQEFSKVAAEFKKLYP